PPLAIDGPIMSIRRFGRDPLMLNDLILLKSFTKEIGEIMTGIIKSKLNVLISGGTGSGKTTLLNVLSQFIPEEERIVTIEDAAELQLKQEHLVRMETRPPNIEGKGEVTSRDLVRNSLRMRPDRIIVGEVRGAEAFDMLQAMNTGHDGSLTTIHANSSRDALMRLESMVAMANLEISNEFMRRFIASAISIIIQISRFPDGTRKLISIEDGKVQGHFRFHGVRPRFLDKFAVSGISVPRDIFDPDIKKKGHFIGQARILTKDKK
ncbi:MAG: CpaF family protein, partial [Deltaproteobacteria bacterium]|nr:CpaF family protein [Deltaproteobacteria bacterium]